jgi:hypothetical protein
MPNGKVGTFNRAYLPEESFEQFAARYQGPAFNEEMLRPLYEKARADEWYRSEHYQVAVDKNVEHGFGEGVVLWHLSIKRNDREPIMDWRDLQAIKTAICGAEVEALQIFPAESRVVDTANQYHLYAFMRSGSTLKPMIPVGWTSGMRANNDALDPNRVSGAKQREL